MLSSLSRCSFRPVKVTVNGTVLDAGNGETILDLCDRHNIKIPRLCHHPNLPPRASCRICLVECDGKWLSPACVTTGWDGLKITTNSPKVEAAVRSNLSLLLESHDERCTSCIANDACDFRDYVVQYGATGKKREPAAPEAIEKSTKPIQLDNTKCVLCGRCIRACEFISGQKAIQFSRRASHMSVEPYGGLKLSETNCISCGQCTLFCPVGAITEQGESQAVLAKLAAAKVAIAQVDPSLSANFGEAVGLTAGTITTGKIVSALRQIGFSKVYSAAVGFDLFGLEEAANLLEHLRTGAKTPLYSSYCGAWKSYAAKSNPALTPLISKTPAPAAIVSNLTAQPGAFSVAVTSCIGKKAGLPKADAVITARELAQILRLRGVNFHTLADSEFDAPYTKGYANAGAGGIADLVLRTAAGQSTPISFVPVDGLAGVKTGSVTIGGKTVGAAVIEGAINIPPFVGALAAGKFPTIAYVEVQACPGGCVAGGGSPKISGPQAIKDRVKTAASLNTQTPTASQAVKNLSANAIAALGLSKGLAFLETHS